MSDYTPTAPNGTPTTEQVRYLWGWHGRYMDFDAWLASVKAEAWDEGHLSFYEAGVICPNPYREVRLRRHGVSTSRRNTEKETDD